MKSSTVYHAFAIQETTAIEKLKKELLEVCLPKKLYLLGLTTTQTRTESLFSLHGASLKWISHYYLLVLVQKTKEQSLNAIQDKIENNLQHSIPVTAIVLCIDEFRQWLVKGHPFAAAVYQKGWLLHDAEDNMLPFPKQVSEDELEKEMAIFYKGASLKIGSFLAGAELYKLRKEYRLSAFMLHQVAEQSLHALLLIHTGLRVNTHSIDKLIRYCSMFCHRLTELFPKNSEKNKKLYALLNKAYIDARYKDDYVITGEELSALTGKVKKINEIFEKHKIKNPAMPDCRQ